MSLDLSIAGLGVALHLEDGVVKDQLGERYEGFLATAEMPLEIWVRLRHFAALVSRNW